MSILTQLKRPHGLVILAFVATLSLQYLLNTPDIGGAESQHRLLGENARQLAEAEEAHHFERFLQHISTKSLEDEINEEFATRYASAAAAGRLEGAIAPTQTDEQASHAIREIQPYTLQDALEESKVWKRAFGILVYDPERDIFVGHYNRKNKWLNCNKKLFNALRTLAFILRKVFPDRFCGADCDELVIPVGAGDAPHVYKWKLPYTSGKAPTLMFGSAFRDTSLYSNMIAMPMPTPLHLQCFGQWAKNDGTEVCKLLQSSTGEGVVFFDDLGLKWNDLTPQVVSRTTDFTYLPTLQDGKNDGRGWRFLEDRPIPSRFIHEGEPTEEKRANAIQALNEQYDTLAPRWKAVALTAQAELDAGKDELPWANIKLSKFSGGRGKVPTVGSDAYSQWESVGIATGEVMGPQELAHYKYHIDLAGGGGTTWTGTVDKLAMPGLLFHHLSPTKDYIHDRLKPWKHYIPVRPDLRDLKAKFDWAEAHPTQAKIISEAGTAFMRNLGTLEGFGQMYDEVMVEPLRRIIEAYQPISKLQLDPEFWSWKDILKANKEEPVIECTGLSSGRFSCKMVQNQSVLNWEKYGTFVAR
mmetsp:Transcript_42616/g.89429  ORF Transcript_42616/g.89429 Transcript_42616/m.89429 type:complete len:584 (+) Transcript_42616:84-1835(+)